MKDFNYSRLCDFYGKLLTEKQLGIIKDYYDYDLSLAEIADKYGVSRQCVRRMRLQAEDSLVEYEQKLAIVGNIRKAQEFLTKIQIDKLESMFVDIQ